jgi:hypothetical protein
MKVFQLIKLLQEYDRNEEVFAAIFFKDESSEISDIESLCWNGGVQINIDSERGKK